MDYYSQQNPREIRGIEIAKKFNITKENGFWLVPSQSKSGKYKVTLRPLGCECADWELNRERCKHIHAVTNRYQNERIEELNREQIAELPKPVSTRKTYRQAWSAYNQAQTSEKAEFQRLLAELCKGIGSPAQITGRPRKSLEDVLFTCIFKVYSTFSGRRFATDLSEAKGKGFIADLPHYNSMFRYFDSELLTPHLQMMIEETSLPLSALEQHFAIDSSGLSTTHGFSWQFAKFEEPRLIAKKDWLKLHICCGALTNVITAVRITDQYANDHNYFERLMVDTRANFKMTTITADKAYLSRYNMNAAVMNDAAPFIAFKENSKPTKKDNTVWNKMYHFFAMHKDKYLQIYHRRSNVETAFSMIKRKFGGTLRSKNETSRINEALCKVICHNLCCLIQSMNEFGVEPEFWKEF